MIHSLIIVHHLILAISRIIFLVSGEGQPLVHQRKSLVSGLVKKTQNFPRSCIIMLIIVTCFLIEKKSLSLKPTIKMLTF